MRPSSKPAPYSDTELVRSLKRRSRSADALRQEARSHQMSPIQWRRRSGEIQYWRNSVLENPIGNYTGTQQPLDNSLDSERLPFRSFAPSPSSIHRSLSRDSLKQFQFGSFPGTGANTGTVEQRITTLEVKFNDLEYAIAELQGAEVGKALPSGKGQKRRSLHELFPETSAPPTSPSTTHHGRTFLISPSDSPTPGEDREPSTQPHRSSNAPTIRPTSTNGQSKSLSDPMTNSKCVTSEPFKALMTLITSEQSARRALEEQVRQLQGQVEELRSLSRAGQRPYPTPSPESRSSPMTLRSIRRPLGFPRSRVGSDETSRFSNTDADDSDNEDGFQDVYETPRESQESRFGFRGDRVSPMAGMI